MKKSLLASTALIIFSSGAYAEGVSVTGGGNFGVKFSDGDDLTFHHEFDITFSASGTTDGGLTFGGKVTVDNQEAISGGTAATATTTVDAVKAVKKDQKVLRGLAAKADGSNTDKAVCYVGDNGKIYMKTGTSDSAADIVATEVGTDDVKDKFAAYGFMNAEEIRQAVKYAEASTAAADRLVLATTAAPATEIKAGTGANQPTAFYKLTIPKQSGTECDDAAAGNIMAKGYFAPLDLEAQTLTAATTLSGGTSGTVANHAEVYISLDVHTLTIGSDLAQGDEIAGGIADVGFDGIGVDDLAEKIRGQTAIEVKYDGNFGVGAVSASYGKNEWAAGVKFTIDPVTVGAGFDSDSVMSVGLGMSQGPLSGNVFYSQDSDADETMKGKQKATAMGADVTYKMTDKTSVTLAYGALDNKATMMDQKAYGLGFSHVLGGGATLAAGVGSVNKQTKADLGISMAF